LTLLHCLTRWLPVALLTACGGAASQAPDFVPTVLDPAAAMQRIAAYEAAPGSTASTGMAKYLYQGNPLWLIPSPCCDLFNYLYTATGTALCAPSGGITGGGDGKCPAGITPVATTPGTGTKAGRSQG
jgi:hypothetical protein